ncbi:hypothetical protein I3843_14G122100 [Carya illinoinensis]|uniref:Uncharacterized protein n=1 Tax=Carya illinoinensis TaxID=32201 RepID=A0A922ACX8_CARIL|nr:hypothetical protein I3842_14G124600 [Carya illinoinensis]KAG7947982.1 hypothetical protein I3843_14G122100 [Carya illinoinensis]
MRCHCCLRAPSLQRPPHNACTRSRDALVCAFDPPEICPFALFRKPWQKMDLGRPSLRSLAFLHLEWIWDLYIFSSLSRMFDLGLDRSALLALRSAVGGRTLLWNVTELDP